VRREWGDWSGGFGAQGGVMNVPFSLEHQGPAWTSPYTLTPSAANSWLWEEVRSVGLEGEGWKMLPGGIRVGLLAGFGWGPDQLGRLLVNRGWVMSDSVAGINSRLPLGADPVSPFDERDDRPLVYGGLTAADPWDLLELTAGYLDNLADGEVEAAWRTRFSVFGAHLRPWGPLEIVAQYMSGDADGPNDDNGFQAFYVLGSAHWREHRVTVRYDDFRQSDRDGEPVRSEEGRAATFAYFFSWGLRHRTGVEYVLADSERPKGGDDPSDDLLQVSYRFRY
jgi:hypothetical protein